MALNFTDPNQWEISPEEAVASRRKALDSYQNIAEPALREQQARQRSSLTHDVYKKAAGLASSGRPDQMGNLMTEAMGKAAEMLPAQGKEADAAQLQGAQAKEDIMASRQERAVSNQARNTEETKQKAADYIAKRAFDMGMSARQLALHQNGYLADRALNQMYDDLQAGRENAAEIRQLQSRLSITAQKLRNETEAERAKLQGQLEVDLANKNLEGAKRRINQVMNKYKEAMEAQAKANALQSILGGSFTVAGSATTSDIGGDFGESIRNSISSFGESLASIFGG